MNIFFTFSVEKVEAQESDDILLQTCVWREAGWFGIKSMWLTYNYCIWFIFTFSIEIKFKFCMFEQRVPAQREFVKMELLAGTSQCKRWSHLLVKSKMSS